MPEILLKYEDFAKMRMDLAAYAEPKLNMSSNARLSFGEIYQRSLENGTPESVAERMAAVSIDVASADMKYMPADMKYEDKVQAVRKRAERNLEMYVTNKFRANTPANINFGRWKATYDEDGEINGYAMRDQMGSACFVLPVKDTFGNSIENLDDGILEAWVSQQMLHKGGGGTGFSFAALRPKGSLIGYNPAVDGMKSIDWSASRGVSSGYESFLSHFYNPATDAVKQGNTRRGANMGIQRIDHMDFLDHLYVKSKRWADPEGKLKNFNVSMATPDEVMEAALSDGTYTLYNPQRADPKVKKILQKKFGIEHPELVRRDDIATREQFDKIMAKNRENPRSPVTTPNMYRINDDVMNAYTGEKIGTIVDDIVRIYASKVLRIFSELSHSNGEPGMVFIDRMNEYNPNLFDEEIEATNPCGEQPIPPWDACDLGSVNTAAFVKYETFDSEQVISQSTAITQKVLGDRFTRVERRKDGKIGVLYYDWDGLTETITDGIRFLDNLIDRNDFPGKKILEKVLKNRKIGLGYMGVGDTMVLMKKRYGSEESYEFAEALAKHLHEKSLEASIQLAEERGVFPNWETSFFNPESPLHKWFMSDPETIPDKYRGERKLSDMVKRERKMTYDVKRRNSYLTTHAPTGTIRRTIGKKDLEFGLDNLSVSSSVEPIFTLWEQSNILNQKVWDFSAAAVELFKREGIYSKELIDAIKNNGGSVFVYSYTKPEVAKILGTIPDDVKQALVTAGGGEESKYEISAEQHAKMAAKFQEYNDSAVSKTMNAPKGATVDDVTKAWITLWENGAKGGTVYVDQSRSFQILNVVKEEKVETNGNGTRRPLLQNAITVELPYIGSARREEKGDMDYDPDSLFTTIAFNPVNGKVTGVFQNVAEVDVERLSTMIHANIETSRNLLKGSKSLDKVIRELERIRIEGGRSGVMVDEATMPKDSKERLRFQVESGTTREGLLHSLYVVRFLTENGENLDPRSVQEKENLYWTGQVSLRSIINTKGRLELKSEEEAMPSIFGQRKAIVLPNDVPKSLCPECG